jgi:hypothetical protein
MVLPTPLTINYRIVAAQQLRFGEKETPLFFGGFGKSLVVGET